MPETVVHRGLGDAGASVKEELVPGYSLERNIPPKQFPPPAGLGLSLARLVGGVPFLLWR